jgi:hypothetical protein
LTDDLTGTVGAVPDVALANARQRAHAQRAIAVEWASLSTSGDVTLDSLLKAREDAATARAYRAKLRINGSNIRSAQRRLLQWTGPCALLDGDETRQEMRDLTVDGVVGRLEEQAAAQERTLWHNDAVAQRTATEQQEAATRRNTVVTLGLTVVVGAATFAALAGSTEMKVAIGLLVGTLLGSLGYQVALGDQGSAAVRTWLALLSLAGSIAAVLVASQVNLPLKWLIGVAAVGNAASLVGYCQLTPGCRSGGGSSGGTNEGSP